jgi:hypothetical protein
MPLLETLIMTVAPALAKTVVKVWVNDDKLVSEGASSTIDVLAKLIPDVRARNEAVRQLSAIGEKAAESLSFIFEREGRQLAADEQEAVASLVASTLEHSKITTDLLVEKDLDPARLAEHFLTEAGEQLLLFPEPRSSYSLV